MNIAIKHSGGTQTVPIDALLLQRRIVQIAGKIDDAAAMDFVQQVMCLSHEDPTAPIKVLINSGGGEVGAGMLIYDVIQGSKAPMEMICFGKAYSMAAILFASGRKGSRYAIPFGQPIHAGHYSEQSDRAFRRRMNRHYDNAGEQSRKAEYYERKAARIGTGGISSDDPDVIEKLEAKLAGLQKQQESMKAANRAIRLKDVGKGNAKLREQGFSDEDISKLRKPDFCGRVGFPDYALANNNANIHRIKRRIEELRKKDERKPIKAKTEFYELAEEDNRIQFIFAEKPDEGVRNILKSHAFRWSPSRGAWVRMASANGLYAARRAREELDALLAEKGGD